MIKPSRTLEKIANGANLLASIMLVNFLGQELFFKASIDDFYWGVRGKYYFTIIVGLFLLGSYSSFIFWTNKRKKYRIKTKNK